MEGLICFWHVVRSEFPGNLMNARRTTVGEDTRTHGTWCLTTLCSQELLPPKERGSAGDVWCSHVENTEAMKVFIRGTSEWSELPKHSLLGAVTHPFSCEGDTFYLAMQTNFCGWVKQRTLNSWKTSWKKWTEDTRYTGPFHPDKVTVYKALETTYRCAKEAKVNEGSRDTVNSWPGRIEPRHFDGDADGPSTADSGKASDSDAVLIRIATEPTQSESVSSGTTASPSCSCELGGADCCHGMARDHVLDGGGANNDGLSSEDVPDSRQRQLDELQGET